MAEDMPHLPLTPTAADLDPAARAEAFRASVAALDGYLDQLPAGPSRDAAKHHLAGFAFHAGVAIGLMPSGLSLGGVH